MLRLAVALECLTSMAWSHRHRVERDDEIVAFVDRYLLVVGFTGGELIVRYEAYVNVIVSRDNSPFARAEHRDPITACGARTPQKRAAPDQLVKVRVGSLDSHVVRVDYFCR
jgi:hypothetical protein